MRLLAKTSIYYLSLALPLLLIAGIAGYYLVSDELSDFTDEVLYNEKLAVEKLVAKTDTIQHYFWGIDNSSEIIRIAIAPSYENLFSDTMLADPHEDEMVPCRILKSVVHDKKGGIYLVTLQRITMESDDLQDAIVWMLIIIFSFLLMSFFVANWWLLKKLWKPFYDTIQQLKIYSVKNITELRLKKSSTTEFDELNTSLEQMTDTIAAEYRIQKEFTENASHEIQTPLAVIQARLDLLMQSSNMKESEMEHLETIGTSVKKLSALNRSLLLLAKIENNQFKDTAAMSFQRVLEQVLLNFSDWIESKEITVQTKVSADFVLEMNPTLCDVLVTNLIQNAIRHNHSKGNINIEINSNSIHISNTGSVLNNKAEDLFTRFKKNEASAESIGLGLSIVKSITVLYSLTIEYNFIEQQHTFALKL